MAPPAAGSALPVIDPLPERRAAYPQRHQRPWWALPLALGGAALALGAAALGWRAAIAAVSLSAAGIYRPELIERGRVLAAIGNCVACRTAEGGRPNTGDRPLTTPFGTVYSSNLTPDAATGIGSWSFSAFQRAMREGVSRDGHRLYPVFPYTAFSQTTDNDLQALYAWLMVPPARAAVVPPTRLAFPFNLRPLLGLWNALFLDAGPVPAAPPGVLTDAAPARSALWQRGAYLVNGLGHCGACHTPRVRLGAELYRTAYLAGALADGWEAPALGALSRSPIAWTEAACCAGCCPSDSPGRPHCRRTARPGRADVPGRLRRLPP